MVNFRKTLLISILTTIGLTRTVDTVESYLNCFYLIPEMHQKANNDLRFEAIEKYEPYNMDLYYPLLV